MSKTVIPLRCITKVEVRGLWDKYDLDWSLDSEVNILAGANGSGKSTILMHLYHLLSGRKVPMKGRRSINSIKVIFNNNKYIYRNFETLHYDSFLEALMNDESLSSSDKDEIIQSAKDKKLFKATLRSSKGLLDSIEEVLKVDMIDTFDNPMLVSEAVKSLSDGDVISQLDYELYLIVKKYLEYKLEILSNIAILWNEVNDNDKIAIPKVIKESAKLKKKDNIFIDQLNMFFKDTGKKLDISWPGIRILSDENNELKIADLSSGEKQIMLILLTTLLQDEVASIMILDEPEVSLHFDWQRKLLATIKLISPKSQVIISTHSPAIIMEGWGAKVKNVKDLILK